MLWDRDLTPSSWHGVTTVIMGNCGFGIAPTRPADRDVILRTLENVEGMTLEALEAGLPWTFETFPEYLDAIDAEPTRLNVAALFGHTPLRFYVMGDDATEREATDDEVTRMKALLAEGLDAGAIGLSSSRTDSHIGAHGKPVPSRAAALSEIRALAGVLGEKGRGTFESTWGPDLHVEEFADIAREIGRPVSWAALMTIKENPALAADTAARVTAAGGSVHPQVSCRPIVVQIALSDPAPFANVPAFEEILRLERDDRPALYADPAWQERAWTGLQERWGQKLREATVAESTVHADLVDGPTLDELARDRGTTPMGVMADLALAENLETRFRMVMINDDDDQIAALLADERFLLGLSDAGAHASQLCDANYATHLLAHFWRDRGDLTLESAVWRLTGHPAQVYGLGRPGSHRRRAGRRSGGLRPEHRRHRPRRAGRRLPRGRRPAGGAQHRDRARVGRRHGHPTRRCRPARRAAGPPPTRLRVVGLRRGCQPALPVRRERRPAPPCRRRNRDFPGRTAAAGCGR